MKSGALANVRIGVEKLICVEKFSKVPQLGRFTLRNEGTTIAIGEQAVTVTCLVVQSCFVPAYVSRGGCNCTAAQHPGYIRACLSGTASGAPASSSSWRVLVERCSCIHNACWT